jgi:acyl-CoA thioesterase
MRFDQVIAQFNVEQPDNLSILVPENWGQGRAVFGGMAAALALQHVLYVIPSDMSLRSVSVSFVAPLNAGEAIVKRRVLRRGGSVIQTCIEITQQDQSMLVMLASFGKHRSSEYFLEGEDVPSWSSDEVKTLPKKGPVPEFTRHFDYQILQGSLPFSRGNLRSLGGQIRFNEDVESNVTYPELLALIDAWPPVSLTLLSSPAAASSMTWTVEFIDDMRDFKASDWWVYLANIEYAADGYHHIEAKMWRPDGKLAAISRQTVAVFA